MVHGALFSEAVGTPLLRSSELFLTSGFDLHMEEVK